MQRRELPEGWDDAIPAFPARPRKGSPPVTPSSQVQNAIAEAVPWLIAGSADLTPSTSARLTFDGAVDFEPGAAAAASSTSGSASTPRPPSPTASR